MIHESSKHTMKDGRVFTVLNDTILVRPHERSKVTKGGLVLTGDTDVWNTGDVLAFGALQFKSGKEVKFPDLKIGDVVVYIRYLAEQHSNHYIRDVFDGLIRLKSTDIVLVLDPEDVPRLFS